MNDTFLKKFQVNLQSFNLAPMQVTASLACTLKNKRGGEEKNE